MNSPPVAYAADAAPGMMKMASALVDSDSEVGGGPEAVDPLRPRARPTVWPGRRSVPGIVAPRPRGSTWSRLSSTATSPATGLQQFDGLGSLVSVDTTCPSLCPPSGSGTAEARPQAWYNSPVVHGGKGVMLRYSPNSPLDFRSNSSCRPGRHPS